MNVKLIIVFFIVAFTHLSVLAPTCAAIEDGILAVVDDELITVKELKEYIQSAYINLTAKGFDEKAIQEALLDMEINGLNRLIEDKLILSRANSIGLEVREKIIDDRIVEIKSKYPSDEEFLNALVKSGSTITDIRNKIREQMKIQYVIDHEVKSKIYVNPSEVTRYYQDHIADYQKKERVVLDSIFIAFKNDKPAAEAKAKEAIAKINEGVAFEEVAKQYSDTAPLGIVEKGQFMPIIENTVFALEKEEVTPPVEVDVGIYIFKLKDKLDAQTASIEEVKESIYNLIFREKFKVKFNKWIADLKKKAYVEIKQ